MKVKEDYPWKEAYQALQAAVQEDVTTLKQTVGDEDTNCAARDLRRERLHAFEHVLSLSRVLERWEF